MRATESPSSPITVEAAASLLGVSSSQVRILLRDGKLSGVRGVRSWWVDQQSVAAYLRLDQGRGRHWSPESSWAVLHALDGSPLPPMPPMSAARVKQRIRQNTAEMIAKNVAWRTSGVRFQAGRRRSALSGLTLTGLSARPQVRTDGTIEGYFAGDDFDRFVADHRLTKDPAGTLVIYLRHGVGPMGVGVAPPAVVAADLARSSDPIIHATGVARLEAIRLRWVDAHRR